MRIPAGLVWLGSYPKSGNTWMRVLIANLMSGRDDPVDINRLSENDSLIGNWRFLDDMLIDADLLSPDELRKLRRSHLDFVADDLTIPFFCKTHDLFDKAVLGERARCALYLMRDPRDVAISLSHHLSISLDEAITQMSNPNCYTHGTVQLRCRIGDWGTHVASWTEQVLVRTMVVRYEDLRSDTVGMLSEIVSFFGGIADGGEKIASAVRHSELDVLQGQEAARGFREATPGQARFFRSGLVGEWQNVMTPAQVRRIEQSFLPLMTRFGYTPSGILNTCRLPHPEG